MPKRGGASLELNHLQIRKGGNPRVHIKVEKVGKLVQEGMDLKDISRTLGVSRTTVSKYIYINMI